MTHFKTWAFFFIAFGNCMWFTLEAQKKLESYQLELLEVKSDALQIVCDSVFKNLTSCLGIDIGKSREILTLEGSVLDLDFNSLEPSVIFFFKKDYFFYPDNRFLGVVKVDSGYIFVPKKHNNSFWFDYTGQFVVFEVESDVDEVGSGLDPGCAYSLKKGGILETRFGCSCE